MHIYKSFMLPQGGERRKFIHEAFAFLLFGMASSAAFFGNFPKPPLQSAGEFHILSNRWNKEVNHDIRQRDALNRADRQWEQEQEWDWKLLPDAFCDNEDFRHWCAERNPPPWHDFKMSVRQENKGMMGKMVACAEKNEWTNFLLLADVCGPDTVLRVFCQCVVDRNDEAVAGIVRAYGKANIQLPLRELAFKCIGWGPKDAIEILKAIEESAPGMCAALYDRFGCGLLWYSSYLDPKTMGEKFNPFSRQNALAQFLLQCGCDPACENVNGLAWEDLVDA